MSRTRTNEQIAEYWHLYRELGTVYAEYAKRCGTTYSGLLVLYILYDHPEGCMQKNICDESFLPKQTVNQITTALYRQGFVRLVKVESDRRYKTIHLTDSGLGHANGMVTRIKDAETKAMESLSKSQQAALLESSCLFISRLHDSMREEAR
jgi:DNA-binding MarR family transcriptional regulator